MGNIILYAKQNISDYVIYVFVFDPENKNNKIGKELALWLR